MQLIVFFLVTVKIHTRLYVIYEFLPELKYVFGDGMLKLFLFE